MGELWRKQDLHVRLPGMWRSAGSICGDFSPGSCPGLCLFWLRAVPAMEEHAAATGACPHWPLPKCFWAACLDPLTHWSRRVLQFFLIPLP